MKTLIVNAILKISTENPALNHEGAPSAEAARNDFIQRLIAELFPECPTVDLPSSTVDQLTSAMSELSISIPAEPAPKKRGPMSEEAKAAMKAKRDATKAAKAAPAPAPATPVAAPAAPAAPVPAAPKKAAKKTSSEPAPPVLPASPKTKAAPKKKAAAPAAGEVNLAKIDPTWRKHLKAAEKDRAKEAEPELLTYLNGLAKDAFNAKKAEEHVQDFLTAWRTAAVQAQETELDVVEFQGKDYLVNPETKRVYEFDGYDADGAPLKVNPVGYVGMAAFATMDLPE